MMEGLDSVTEDAAKSPAGRVRPPLLAFGPAGLALVLAIVTLRSPSATWALEYFPNPDLAGVPIRGRVQAAELDTRVNALAEGLPEREDFSVRLRTCFDPPEKGLFRFRVTADGGARLFLDSEPLVDLWAAGPVRSAEKLVEVDHAPHVLTLEYHSEGGAAVVLTEMAFPAAYQLRSLSHTRLPGLRGECTEG